MPGNTEGECLSLGEIQYNANYCTHVRHPLQFLGCRYAASSILHLPRTLHTCVGTLHTQLPACLYRDFREDSNEFKVKRIKRLFHIVCSRCQIACFVILSLRVSRVFLRDVLTRKSSKLINHVIRWLEQILYKQKYKFLNASINSFIFIR